MKALVILLLVVGGCAGLINSVQMYTEFTSKSRARGCIANLNSIDKCVGVWESQNIAMRAKQDLWIELDTDGKIRRISRDVAAMADKVPEKAQLLPGSAALFDYTKDVNLFRCPERVSALNSRTYDVKPAEVHYRWVQRSPEPAGEELGGRTRGTICLFHGRVGPRDGPELAHNPVSPR